MFWRALTLKTAAIHSVPDAHQFSRVIGNLPRAKLGGPMNFRNGIKGKSFFLFAALTLVLLNSGCGGNSSQPRSQPQSISVVLSTVSASVVPGGTTTVSATVSNDSMNAGVSWSCAPANACGLFSPSSTASAMATTYTAPAVVPAGGQVTVTAKSITDPTKSASSVVMITEPASDATLSGRYAFFVTSPTGNRGTASLLGSINLGGDGTVAGGVADIISPGVLDLQDQILPTSANPQPNTSSYTVDGTGHGTMNVRTASGQQLAFSFAVTSPAHTLLTEIDGNPGSGTMDLQQHPTGGFTASQVEGGFSFTMTGTAKANAATKVSYGGVFTADGVGSLSGGTLDINTAAIMTTSPFSGSFSAPDSNGRGTLQLGGGRSFTYYVISSKALRLFEADSLNLMGGSAYAQGGSVIFFGNNYFYQNSGWSSAGRTTTAGEFFILESENDISAGISDSNAGGPPATPKSAVKVSGSYDSFPDGTGSLTLVDAGGSSTFNLYVVDHNVNIFDPNASPAGFFSGGGNALMLHTDANVNGTGVVIGNAELGFPPLVGNNALQLTNPITSSTPTNELDLVGFALSDGLAHLSGLVDYDQSDSSNPVAVLGASITGSFAEDTLNQGRATGSVMISTPSTAGAYPFISPAGPSFNVAYYRINSSQAFVLQTDASASSSGLLFQQLLP